jgi:hypothetical protein
MWQHCTVAPSLWPGEHREPLARPARHSSARGVHDKGVRVGQSDLRGLSHHIWHNESGTGFRRGWMVEPVQRVQRQFMGVDGSGSQGGMWYWLELNGWGDWDRIWTVAQRFHPDARFDPVTRELRPGVFPFASAFESMERGELDRELVKLAWSELVGLLPKRVRRTPPQKWYELTLMVSAHLAAHEFMEMDVSLTKHPTDEVKVGRHLYWFERFYGLWRRTAETKRPKEINTRKSVEAADASKRRIALLKFYDEFIQRHGSKVSAARVAQAFSSSAEAKDLRLLADPKEQARELRDCLKERRGAMG